MYRGAYVYVCMYMYKEIQETSLRYEGQPDGLPRLFVIFTRKQVACGRCTNKIPFMCCITS